MTEVEKGGRCTHPREVGRALSRKPGSPPTVALLSRLCVCIVHTHVCVCVCVRGSHKQSCFHTDYQLPGTSWVQALLATYGITGWRYMAAGWSHHFAEAKIQSARALEGTLQCRLLKAGVPRRATPATNNSPWQKEGRSLPGSSGSRNNYLEKFFKEVNKTQILKKEEF